MFNINRCLLLFCVSKIQENWNTSKLEFHGTFWIFIQLSSEEVPHLFSLLLAFDVPCCWHLRLNVIVKVAVTQCILQDWSLGRVVQQLGWTKEEKWFHALARLMISIFMTKQTLLLIFLVSVNSIQISWSTNFAVIFVKWNSKFLNATT